MGAVFGFSGPPQSRWLMPMAAALAHRGSGDRQEDQSPYGTLVYAPPVGTAQRGAAAGLWSDANITLALAGRLHGSITSLAELARQYQRDGVRSCRALRGAFILAIRDGMSIHLVRDGAGARTVNYSEHEGRFVFAIEPKAILAVPGFPRRLRPASLAQYLAFSFVPAQHTMLEGVHELPAGSCVSFDPRRGISLSRLFIAEEHAEESPAPSDSYTTAMEQSDWPRRFRDVLAHSVADRISADHAPTVFLSGGIDSSLVTAELARQSSQPVRSFAIHFGRRYPHELDFARCVAERCGTRHREVEIRPRDFLPRLRRMIWHLDDPIGDPITMPNYELSSFISGEARDVFNGEGGDPCFGGPKNLPMLLHHWYGGVSREPRFRERHYLASYRRGYEEIGRLLAPDFLRQIDFERDLESVLTPYFQARRPARFLDKLCLINIRLKGAHLILPKVERMLGAFGMTPLSPLFDERMVQFSFEVPSTWKLHHGVEKTILKHAFRRDLPAQVLNRPKSGMRVPVHFWFQGQLKKYARKILHPRAVRRAGIFNPQRVRQLLDYNTEEGPGRYGIRLWMLLTFEIWRRIVIEREAI